MSTNGPTRPGTGAPTGSSLRGADLSGGKEVFSTGEAAEVCNVSQQTIIRCFDKGKIGGFRVPGSKFRRIPRADLIRFMRENGIPLERLEAGTKRVLVAEDDARTRGLLLEALRRNGRVEARAVENAFELGTLAASWTPSLVVFDAMMPGLDAASVCRAMKGREDAPPASVVCTGSGLDEKQEEALRRAGADEVWRKPFGVDRLAALAETLLGGSGEESGRA
ncbi:MAG: response regulator [Phycisphaerales bacterium]